MAREAGRHYDHCGVCDTGFYIFLTFFGVGFFNEPVSPLVVKLVLFLAENHKDNHENTKEGLPWRCVLRSVYYACRPGLGQGKHEMIFSFFVSSYFRAFVIGLLFFGSGLSGLG